MDNTVKAAMQGPELKGVKINGHEFNVKPVSYRFYNNELTVFGQLSHCLALRDDDQVWYAFRKKAAVVSPSDPKKMVVKKQDGGIIKTISHLKGIVSIVAMIYGVNSDAFFDQLNNHAGDLAFLDFDGDWETAARSFLNDLAANVLPPAALPIKGLQLYADPGLRGGTINIKVGQQVSSTGSLGWNDKASSLYAVIPDGNKVTIFRDSNFSGTPIELGPGTHSIYDMRIHDFDDAISSVRWG